MEGVLRNLELGSLKDFLKSPYFLMGPPFRIP